MNDNDDFGGFLIPESILIDVEKDDILSKLMLYLGSTLIKLGAWIRTFGYIQKKIHPYKSLINSIKENK